MPRGSIGANGYFHWLADRARAKHDVRTTEGQVAVLKSLMPAVQRISDRMERMVVAGDVAGYLGIDRSMVLDEFKKAVSERSREGVPASQESRCATTSACCSMRCSPNRNCARRSCPSCARFETIGTFTSRRIFQTIFTLSDAGGRLRFEEVNARLEEADQNLLAQAVLGEDMQSSRRGSAGGGGEHAALRRAAPARRI